MDPLLATGILWIPAVAVFIWILICQNAIVNLPEPFRSIRGAEVEKLWWWVIAFIVLGFVI